MTSIILNSFSSESNVGAGAVEQAGDQVTAAGDENSAPLSTSSTTSTQKNWTTIKQTAANLRVSPDWLRSWLQKYAKPLPVIMIRGQVNLFPQLTYEAILEQQGRDGIQVRNPSAPISATPAPSDEEISRYPSVSLRELFRCEV